MVINMFVQNCLANRERLVILFLQEHEHAFNFRKCQKCESYFKIYTVSNFNCF